MVDACDQPATTTTAARASDYFSDSQPSRPSPAQRLVWLAERGIHVDAAPDTRGRWAIETDALSLDDLRAILPPGRKLPRWPSDFAKLRAAWSADTPDAQIQAERTGGERQARRAAEAAAVAAATAQRIREDQLAAAQRQAAQRDHDAALATPLGRRWRGLLSAWGSAVPGCMRSVGTYPLALADGRLVLHVGNPVVEALMRRHELAVLDRCRDAFAPDLVDHLDLIVNGHAHPTIAALPAVAVLAH